MTHVVLGEGQLGLRDLAALGEEGHTLALSDAAWARVARSREIVAAYAAGDEPVYGLNTGLGGNLGFRIDQQAIGAFQAQLVLGRNIGVGAPLPREACRAALAARIASASHGQSGLSRTAIEGLIGLYNAGVTPAIPARGSISAADLGLSAHIASVLLGRGQAWHGADLLQGAEALARAGLKPVELEPKDGLALCNHSAPSAGHAAVTLGELSDMMLAAAGVAALAYEGYAANPLIFDARLQAVRPAAGQAAAAALFRTLLAGSSIHANPRKIQDAVSFRTMAQVFGTAFAALEHARAEAEIEINGAVDTPLVLLDEGLMLSAANFHTSSLALAFDALSIALCHLATASAQRMIKLMSPTLSELPKYLSPVGGPSAGYVPTQKLAASLHAEIRLAAMPASLDAIPVSDAVEDLAPQTLLAIRKLHGQLEPFGLMVALEAVVACQAIDLRQGLAPGPVTAALHGAIRRRVPTLHADRETGLDVMAAREALADREAIAALRAGMVGLPAPQP